MPNMMYVLLQEIMLAFLLSHEVQERAVQRRADGVLL